MVSDDWDEVTTYLLEADDLFAVVMQCPAGHWVWYAINDEKGILLASGSEEELDWAKDAARSKLEELDERIAS